MIDWNKPIKFKNNDNEIISHYVNPSDVLIIFKKSSPEIKYDYVVVSLDGTTDWSNNYIVINKPTELLFYNVIYKCKWDGKICVSCYRDIETAKACEFIKSNAYYTFLKGPLEYKVILDEC